MSNGKPGETLSELLGAHIIFEFNKTSLEDNFIAAPEIKTCY